MIKERLERLVQFGRTSIPPERFNYTMWVGEDWQGHDDLRCGTTACVLGWATQVPEFRAAGLRLFQHDISRNGMVCLDTPDMNETSVTNSLHAAQEFFGLTHYEAHWLFIPGDTWDWPGKPRDNATLDDVITHIQAFIDSDGVMYDELGNELRDL